MERLTSRALTRRMNELMRTAQYLPVADLPVADAASPERKGTR
jgi:hypothetical protein